MSQKRYLGDLVDFVNGDRSANYPSASDYIEGGIPFISATEIDSGRIDLTKCKRISREAFDRLRSGKVIKGDTLYCLRGTLGKIGRVSDFDEGAIASSLAIVRAKPDVSADFIYYFLASPEGQTAAIALNNGSAQPNISVKALSRLVLDCPPLPEQRAIAATLGALDDKIELNRKMNATLEAMARALFRDWFVDFGPTRAKMEAREPYLSPDLWSLFPDRFDAESKPEGWEAGTVGDLVTFNPKEALRKGIAVPYLDMAALPTQGANHSAPLNRPFTSGSKFRDGDTLMARITPCLENGKTCLVQGLGSGTIGWGSTEFVVMRAKEPLPSAFSYLLARDAEFRGAAIKSMTGTSGRQRATVEAIASRAHVVPPPAVSLKFGELINPLFERIAKNELESRTLAQTRDLLLPRLMSGELRVAAAERFAEAVL